MISWKVVMASAVFMAFMSRLAAGSPGDFAHVLAVNYGIFAGLGAVSALVIRRGQKKYAWY